jgi:hypothetical protein
MLFGYADPSIEDGNYDTTVEIVMAKKKKSTAAPLLKNSINAVKGARNRAGTKNTR